MKFLFCLLAICISLSFTCRASDLTAPSNDTVSCPAEIQKGFIVPHGASLIGQLLESKKKLQSVALIQKSGTVFLKEVDEWSWDEEIVEWEATKTGSMANTEFDSTQNDWELRCGYPGGFDPKKKRYIEIFLLLPIQEHVPISCKFSRTKKGKASGYCRILP